MRRHFLKLARLCWRFLLWSLLALLLLLVPTLALLGSETGSRWLLEQGVGMQKMLDARYQSGTFLTGLELADVHLRTRKIDVQVRHLLARWSLLQLLRAEIGLERLQLEGLDIRQLTPSTAGPIRLPVLVIPFRLVIQDAAIDGIRVYRYGHVEPLILNSVELAGRWQGFQADVDRLVLRQSAWGRVFLSGQVRLRGAYPLQASGQWQYPAFTAKGWQPLRFSLAGEVAHLELGLRSAGALTAEAKVNLQPLQPELPFTLQGTWQAFQWPWWSDQNLASTGGEMRLSGDKSGLDFQLQAGLSGRHIPAGQYRSSGHTNWNSVHIESFDFNGLMGKAKASADVSWRQSDIAWTLAADMTQLDLARQWPVSPALLPRLTGRLQTKGHTSKAGSAFSADLALQGGERWRLTQQGESWPWQLEARQSVALEWKQLQRPLPGVGPLHSSSGWLKASGRRSDFRLQAETALSAARLPEGNWRLDMYGGDQHLVLEQLHYTGRQGAATLAGELDFGPVWRWRGSAVASDFQSGWLLPDWSGQFDGHVQGSGDWTAREQNVRIEELDVHGLLRDRPLTVRGPGHLRLVAGARPEFYSPQLKLRWGSDAVDVNGGLLNDRWALDGTVEVADVSVFVPGLKGQVEGSFALSGAESRPQVKADLTAAGLGNAAVHAETASLQLDLQALGDQSSQLVLYADGLTTGSGHKLGALGLELTGTLAEHRLLWEAGSQTVHGQGRLSGSYKPDTGDWQGRLETGQVILPEMDWLLARAAALGWSAKAREFSVAAHCWRSLEASLCADDEIRLGQSGQASVQLAGLLAERLNPLLPEGLALEGELAGHASGHWQFGQLPVFKAELGAVDGAVLLARDEPAEPLRLPYESVSLGVELADQVNLRLGLVSEAVGRGELAVSVNPHEATHPLAGQLSLQGLRMDLFLPFFPGLAGLAGSVSADGRLEGTVAQPRYWGGLRLENGELALHRLPVNLHGVTLAAEVRGDVADITGRVASGQGEARLTGAADWSGEQPRLNLAIKGERFELRQEPQLIAEINPDLSLSVVPGQLDIGGQILVPDATINLKPLTEKAVPLSSDVRIVTAADGSVRVQGSVASNSQWLINADVLVRLGDEVYFHGFGVNGRLIGAVRLRQQGRKSLEASGEVELDKDSRYDAYGQRLQIRRGRLIFAGNLMLPGLDVEAVREIDSQVVGVRVEGRANAPEVSFFSDGGSLSQEEILSYLVLGRPLDTSSGKEGPNLSAAAAAIKLGATGGAGLTSQLGESFGITDLALDAEGDGDDTQVTVSGYLSPKLYLRYGVGIFTPVNTATIRYKINSKLYLEAVSSLESAIDLFYNLKF